MNGVKAYLLSAAGIALVVAVLAPLHQQITSATAGFAFLIVVLVVATVFGSRPAYLASFLGVLSFNYFFLPPLYTFTIADSQNWVALAAFLATAVIAGQLSSYARRRASESEDRRLEIESYNRGPGTYSINGRHSDYGVSVNGWQWQTLGRITWTLTGTFIVRNDGNYSFSGSAGVWTDNFNFDPSNRNFLAEALTYGASYLPGKPYDINFSGSFTVSFSSDAATGALTTRCN